MTITEMDQAIADARAQLNRADLVATSLARLLVGRLRKVEASYLLSELKKELKHFNIHTGRWSNK